MQSGWDGLSRIYNCPTTHHPRIVPQFAKQVQKQQEIKLTATSRRKRTHRNARLEANLLVYKFVRWRHFQREKEREKRECRGVSFISFIRFLRRQASKAAAVEGKFA